MNDVHKTEEFLKRLKPKPAPPGLRRQLLDRTERRMGESGVLGLAGWRVLGASLALLVLAWACDGLLSKAMNQQVSSILGWSGPEPNPDERSWKELGDEIRLSNGGREITPWLARRPERQSRAEQEAAVMIMLRKENSDEL